MACNKFDRAAQDHSDPLAANDDDNEATGARVLERDRVNPEFEIAPHAYPMAMAIHFIRKISRTLRCFFSPLTDQGEELSGITRLDYPLRLSGMGRLTVAL